MKKRLIVTRCPGGRLIALLMVTFLLSGWATSTLLAQEGRGVGRLKGFVIGSDRKPIAGATVTIEYKDYNRKLSTTSNKNGKWTFGGLGVGIIMVNATKEGYAPSGISLKVSGVQKNPEQHIVLKKLEEIKVKPEDDANAKLRSQFKKADALFDERLFEAALALYQDFLKQKPGLYKIRVNIANCYLELRRFDEAIEEFKKVKEAILVKNPEVKGNFEIAQIYSSIGDTYMRQDKLKEAEKYFKESIEIAPNDHALAYNVAEILFAAGKTDDAIKYYDMAIRINPKFAKSYMQRGYAFLNKGDIKKAKESFNLYLEIAGKSPEADGVREVIKSL